MLELPGGMLRFNAPGRPWDGQPFLSPRVIFPMNKESRKLIWSNVPVKFVQDNYGYMTKLGAGIGKINSKVFFGDPNGAPGGPGQSGAPGRAHCWLLEHVDTQDTYSDPIASAVMNRFTQHVDIILHLTHFNPPSGHEDGNTEAGWRLNLAADGLYYRGKYSVDPLGVINFPQNWPRETDFDRFFTHHSDIELP